MSRHVGEDVPLFPYAGSSGYAAGVDTSRDRAEREDRDGTTARRQRQVLAALQAAGRDGLTWHELARAHGWHHGQASGALSVLHKVGKIARLTERRDRCYVYAHLEHVQGRDTAPHRSARHATTCANCGEALST